MENENASVEKQENQKSVKANLVVSSQVKDVVRKAEMNMAGDFADGLSRKVEQLVSDAVARAKANDRKTVRAADV